MKTVQLREAKATFSALADEAEHGRPTAITRHGAAVDARVSVEAARKLYPDDAPSFADCALSFPGGVEFERDPTPMREFDA